MPFASKTRRLRYAKRYYRENYVNVKIFADGADVSIIKEFRKNLNICGYTTNPTLIRRAGITDYKKFCKDVLVAVDGLPISFEVFSDDNSIGGGMYSQAMKIAGWGDNVYVKIPITDTLGKPSLDLIHMLSYQGVKVNVTAIMTIAQVTSAAQALVSQTPSYISVFAGRIADTGRNPIPDMVQSLDIIKYAAPNTELIWASPREVLNIVQADEIGCHIITVTNDLLKKMPLFGKSLIEYSLETVQMFYNDAKASGYAL